MSSLDVLIAGAGPTGLALAGLLTKAGISHRLIEKNEARSDKSKALGVQAGTLEALEDVFGAELPRQMIQAGRPTRQACIHLNRRAPIRVDLSSIPSRHNFILILEQSETERFLEQQCASVERRHELLSFTQDGAGVHAQVRAPDGTTETVHAKYLVGCDGAHSTVRHQLGFAFQGGAYEGHFILGDLHVQWPWDYGSVHAFLSKRGAMACFPLKREQRYRLILIPKATSGDGEISLAEFQTLAGELAGADLTLSDPNWLTRFSVHHRIVKRLRADRVFLAGDAAHIHSPAGGQGMNTGIQDSLNLGAKLIQVLRQDADPTLLEDYEKERLPVAQDVLRATDFVFRWGILAESPILTGLRNFLMPKILGQRCVQKRVAAALSEVTIARRERPGRLKAVR